jgi:hypothetical protein
VQLYAGHAALLELEDDGVEDAVLAMRDVRGALFAGPAVGTREDQRSAGGAFQESYAELFGVLVGHGVWHLCVPEDAGVRVQVETAPVLALARPGGGDLVVTAAGCGVGEAVDAEADGGEQSLGFLGLPLQEVPDPFGQLLALCVGR